MTDKERLEEFREFIDFMYESIDIEDHQRFVAISDSLLKDGWFKWIYRFAKEQAERVQELEDIIYQDARQEVLEGLYEENKRYRDGIKLAMKETDCDNTWDFLGRLLEGKEETDLPYRIGYKEESE